VGSVQETHKIKQVETKRKIANAKQTCVFKAYQLIFKAYQLIFKAYQLIFKAYQLIFKAYQLISGQFHP